MSITWPVSVVLVHRGIQREDDQLAAEFGDDLRRAMPSRFPRYLGDRSVRDRHPVSPCSNAYAAAAVRDDTSSLTKMLLR